ncbi:non-structural maintenance of chromosomes element 1 homolog [Macadamia integrifolia]|uniref:non-structural maintenance of chromosomes element 1 homolog n=1 Tax=Macadamia integrifolia TaxID=60698 RepID=UPI001C530443|nr:non-structural maintenance of chromosomes element 1 homolog [Macadamia integrifolia]
MPALSPSHHTLVQTLLSRGPLKEDDFHKVFMGVTGKSPGSHKQLFNDYLLKINKELSYVQFELRGCRNQYDGKVYYGVVNNVADEQSKLGTKYSVPQIAFYKGIIEAIVQDANAYGSISNIDALNIRLDNQTGMASQSQGSASQVPPAFRNFTISQKEKTLGDLVEDQWLCFMPEGSIGLGVRSFLDLRSWFRSNGVPSCDVCNEAGVKAELCQKENCTVRIHCYCLKKKFSQRRVERVCPGCGSEWHLPVSKVEAVEDEEEKETTGSTQRQLTLSGTTTRKRSRSCKTEVETVEVGSSQASNSICDLRRTTRSSTRLR